MPPAVNLSELSNFGKVDEFLLRGGQPDAKQFTALKNCGVSLVVSLKPVTIELPEGDIVRKLGMAFLNLPFKTDKNPPPEHVADFFKAIDGVRANNQKAFVHCSYGSSRTGLFAAMYKLKYGLADIDECVREMARYGHSEVLVPNTVPYLRSWHQHILSSNKP